MKTSFCEWDRRTEGQRALYRTTQLVVDRLHLHPGTQASLYIIEAQGSVMIYNDM